MKDNDNDKINDNNNDSNKTNDHYNNNKKHANFFYIFLFYC